jgi:hypothetical protein
VQKRDLGSRCRNATVICTNIVLAALSLGNARAGGVFRNVGLGSPLPGKAQKNGGRFLHLPPPFNNYQ